MNKATRLDYKHHGLSVYETEDGKQYAVGDDTVRDEKGRTRVDRAARRAARGSLWAFNTSFIVRFIPSFDGLRDMDKIEAALGKMQSELCEDAGPVVRALLGKKLARFLDDAIRADGRAHFLSTYDGEELDSDDVEGLPKGKIAFRIN